MKLSNPNPESLEQRRPVRSWRARRRSIISFILLFCLIPIFALFLSSTSIFDWGTNKEADKAAAVALGGSADSRVPDLPGLPEDMAEAEAELTLKLSAEAAIAFNDGVPESQETIVPARPFVIPANVTMELSRSTAINCLTSAIYYEASIEAERGQRAVAQVVLNRVRHPAYPNNICGVIFQGSQRTTGCQFSFTCDGSLARTPSPAVWKRIQKLAAEAISGTVEPSVGTATHYHTVWIVPYWAKSLVKVKTVGSHIFYRWSGYWGKRSAFSQKYGGENLSEEVLGGSENNIDIEQGYEITDQQTTEQPLYVPEVDPIMAQKFETKTSSALIPSNNGLAADDTQSPIAADNDKGTLILD